MGLFLGPVGGWVGHGGKGFQLLLAAEPSRDTEANISAASYQHLAESAIYKALSEMQPHLAFASAHEMCCTDEEPE